MQENRERKHCRKHSERPSVPKNIEYIKEICQFNNLNESVLRKRDFVVKLKQKKSNLENTKKVKGNLTIDSILTQAISYFKKAHLKFQRAGFQRLP